MRCFTWKLELISYILSMIEDLFNIINHNKWYQEEPLGYVLFTFAHVRGTLWLCCVYIAQLMTHPAVYTLPFILQLCYKSLGILQRVTKGQKVHFWSHDGWQNLKTSLLGWREYNHVFIGFASNEFALQNFDSKVVFSVAINYHAFIAMNHRLRVLT